MAGKPRVFVTRRWPAAVETGLTERFDAVLNTDDRPLAPEELRSALLSFDALLPTVTDAIGGRVLDLEAPRARIIANYGAGFGHIDLARARELGIAVTNTPDVLSDCTADLAMMLLLMVARRAGEGLREIAEHRWSGWRPTHMMGSRVSGKVLGIIGFGRIGQAVAQRAHHGFGMDIRVQNRSPVAPEVLARSGARQMDSVEALLPGCDFVTLHCPGGAQTRHLINAKRLALMKPGALLVNTARGEVVDEAALAHALCAGVLGGAGLDVFEREPCINPALRACPNLVMLPHLGSATLETREAMGFRVMANLEDFFSGQGPRDRIA
ncbi:2-hydroxyacid dehydrogenase [Pontibaca methylaminivorans]|uniref:2-hydroxyacid dehydrogenase n=1 Tax=Pontibaca methylaminivorans TaxID=515897 RepID=UPI002FD881A8